MRRQLDNFGLWCVAALVAVAFGFVCLCLKAIDTVWITDRDYRQQRAGKASWYTGSGLVCASRQYPIGTVVRVYYRHSSIVVQVTSRGPAWRFFRKGRIIDLSREAFTWLENPRIGLIDVRVERWDYAGH